MTETWWGTALPLLISIAVLVVPGLAILLAGWGWNRSGLLLLAPAASVAVIGVAAVAAPVVNAGWSVVPVAILTAIIAAAAYAIRRFLGAPREASPPLSTSAVGLVSLGAAALVLLQQFTRAFGGPENIAQRFDNIVHLNTVAFAVDTGNASPFHIGATSDIPFYPNGWHALCALIAETAGVDVPVAVNVGNLAIVAIVWPASCLALAAVLFRQRKAAFVITAALTTAFGVFPALFFNWGTLYPNALGYAIIPAVIAAITRVCRSRGVAQLVREGALLALLLGGCGLAHPNAVLAILILGGSYAIGMLAIAVRRHRSRSALTALLATAGALAAVFLILWPLVRTPPDHSKWSPWNSLGAAFGEGMTTGTRGYPLTFLVVAVIFVGVAAVIRRPRLLPILLPFASAIALFMVVAGLTIDSPVRQWLTNPWYNDPNRLAALLPIGAIPVATLGALAVLDAVARLVPRRLEINPLVRAVSLVVLAVVMFTAAKGPNVSVALGQVEEAYAETEDARILSNDERALLDRLDDEVPDDALIVGSPRTGTSLAYAIADRQVLRKHIFGNPGPDEQLIDRRLRDIEYDPSVCAAVDALGVDYVLDFGTLDAFDDNPKTAAEQRKFRGLVDLRPSAHLVLVDSEGASARLFRIEGC